MVRLRLRTVKSLSMTKLSWLDGRHSGELSARVSGDLNALAGALRPVLIMGISLAIVQIITVTFLFTLHLRLTLLIFGVVPVTVLLQWLSSNPIKKYRTANRNAMGQLSSVLYDCAGSMETIKSLSLEEEMRHRFAATQALQMGARLKEEKIVAALSPVSVFGRYLPQMVLILAGGYFVVEGNLTIGEIMVFMALSGNALRVFDNLTGLIASLRQLGVNAGRVVELWDVPVERQSGLAKSSRQCESGINSHAYSLKQEKAYLLKQVNSLRPSVHENSEVSAITLENITFAYSNGESVLHDLSISVKNGEFVALVGESGSGKSTVLKLCASLYDAQAGDIRICDLSLDEWNLDTLRDSIAYVSQDTWLFSGTLEDNITCGKPCSPEKMDSCLVVAGLSDFVENLPNGLQTQVGERGVFLSGGQRQRIAIARAVYKEADILLLDEATSALDRSTEALVMDGLLSLPEMPAILMITHHLANVEQADRIVVLKNGFVTEEGSHAFLEAANGEYSRLLSGGKGEVVF